MVEMHHILDSIEFDKLGKVQVRDHKNQVVSDFSGTASLDTIKECVAELKGAGEYTIIGIDTRGKQMRGQRRLKVEEGDVPVEDEAPGVDQAGVIAARALAWAERREKDGLGQLDTERKRLDEERTAFERSKNATMSDIVSQHRQTMELLAEREDARRKQLHEEFVYKDSQLKVEAERNRREHEERMAALEARETRMQRQHEERMAALEVRNRELEEERREMDRNAAEERMQIQIEGIRAEQKAAVAALKRDAQSAGDIPKAALNIIYERWADRAFPPISPIENIFEQIKPLLGLVAGGIGFPGMPVADPAAVQGEDDVLLIGDEDIETPDIPTPKDLGPAIPLPPSARPRGAAPEPGPPIPLPPSARPQDNDSMEL
jgi:hypothetical protein